MHSGYFRLWCHLAGKFNQSEPSSQHVVDGHPRGVTKGRRRFLYHKTSSDDSGCGSAHSCVECRKKTTQGCVQHPTAKTTARYCLRIQLKQEDISMWSTAFHESDAHQCQCTVLKDRDFSMAAAWDDICGSSKTRSYQ